MISFVVVDPCTRGDRALLSPQKAKWTSWPGGCVVAVRYTLQWSELHCVSASASPWPGLGVVVARERVLT